MIATNLELKAILKSSWKAEKNMVLFSSFMDPFDPVNAAKLK